MLGTAKQSQGSLHIVAAEAEVPFGYPELEGPVGVVAGCAFDLAIKELQRFDHGGGTQFSLGLSEKGGCVIDGNGMASSGIDPGRDFVSFGGCRVLSDHPVMAAETEF
jgi:hypothetical protein